MFKQDMTKSIGMSILTAVSSADNPCSIKRRTTASNFPPDFDNVLVRVIGSDNTLPPTVFKQFVNITYLKGF